MNPIPALLFWLGLAVFVVALFNNELFWIIAGAVAMVVGAIGSDSRE